MSDILCNGPELDRKMIEGIAPACWVLGPAEDASWKLVVHVRYTYGLLYLANGRYLPDSVAADEIVALHEPCREPTLATAYKIGEPGTVTRAMAKKMLVHENWLWNSNTEFSSWHPLWEESWPGCTGFIRSPAGNVYRIEG